MKEIEHIYDCNTIIYCYKDSLRETACICGRRHSQYVLFQPSLRPLQYLHMHFYTYIFLMLPSYEASLNIHLLPSLPNW